MRKPIKKFSKGSTLVEIIVSISIISAFSLIVVADFPRIKRQFAVSRATYAVAQDIRKAEDLGLSGAQLTDSGGDPIQTNGYGFYINLLENSQQYIIYADTNSGEDEMYSGSSGTCDQEIGANEDCIVERINVTETEDEAYIKGIYDANTCDFNNIASCESDKRYWISINFMPPNPKINIITDLTEEGESESKIGIVVGMMADNNLQRVIFVNSTGLIYVQ